MGAHTIMASSPAGDGTYCGRSGASACASAAACCVSVASLTGDSRTGLGRSAGGCCIKVCEEKVHVHMAICKACAAWIEAGVERRRLPPLRAAHRRFLEYYEPDEFLGPYTWTPAFEPVMVNSKRRLFAGMDTPYLKRVEHSFAPLDVD